MCQMATKDLGNQRFVLVDIGASGGESSRWKRVCRDYQAILFEPDSRARRELISPNSHRLVLSTALSDRRGEIDFHLCRAQPLSSVYYPNSELMKEFLKEEYLVGYDVINKIRLPCDTLDNQLLEHQIPDVDFIKIDVQGHELAVLRGAAQSLGKAIGLEIEVEFLEVYKNQPLFGEVDEFVRGMGYDIFDLEKSYFKRRKTGYYGVRKGQIIFGIALYYISPEKMFERLTITDRKLVNAAIAYATYGYFDAAEVVTNLGRDHQILSTQSHEELKELISKYQRRFRMPDFRGRHRIHRSLAKLTRAFGGEGVNFSDMGVGNF